MTDSVSSEKSKSIQSPLELVVVRFLCTDKVRVPSGEKTER